MYGITKFFQFIALMNGTAFILILSIVGTNKKNNSHVFNHTLFCKTVKYMLNQ